MCKHFIHIILELSKPSHMTCNLKITKLTSHLEAYSSCYTRRGSSSNQSIPSTSTHYLRSSEAIQIITTHMDHLYIKTRYPLARHVTPNSNSIIHSCISWPFVANMFIWVYRVFTLNLLHQIMHIHDLIMLRSVRVLSCSSRTISLYT